MRLSWHHGGATWAVMGILHLEGLMLSFVILNLFVCLKQSLYIVFCPQIHNPLA